MRALTVRTSRMGTLTLTITTITQTVKAVQDYICNTTQFIAEGFNIAEFKTYLQSYSLIAIKFLQLRFLWSRFSKFSFLKSRYSKITFYKSRFSKSSLPQLSQVTMVVDKILKFEGLVEEVFNVMVLFLPLKFVILTKTNKLWRGQKQDVLVQWRVQTFQNIKLLGWDRFDKTSSSTIYE